MLITKRNIQDNGGRRLKMTFVLFDAECSFQPYGSLVTADKAKFDSTLASNCILNFK